MTLERSLLGIPPCYFPFHQNGSKTIPPTLNTILSASSLELLSELFSHFFHSSRHLPVIFSMLFKMSTKRPTRPLLLHFSFSFSANFQKSWSKVCATSIIFFCDFTFPLHIIRWQNLKITGDLTYIMVLNLQRRL